MRNYATPHCHIQSLDSASTPAAFVKRELELGTGVVTVTDHGSLAACYQTFELAKKAGLTPVLGIEGYVRDDNCPILLAKGVERRHPKKKGGKEDETKPLGFQQYIKYHHITLHFQDFNAFQTGVRLLSKAPIEVHGSEGKPLFTWADLEELGQTNTTMTTGCLIGMVQRHLLDHEDPVTARKYYEKLRSLVKPGNFYVEAFPHVCSHNWVKGVFVTGSDSQGARTLRFYDGKTLRTNVCDIKAVQLAEAWRKTGNNHQQLLGIKNRSSWQEIEPFNITNVVYDEGSFIQNECGPYSPDGDVQLGANRFVIDLAHEYGDPILCSDDAHYAHKDEKIVQDVRLAQSGDLRFYGNYHRQSSAEAFDYFRSKLGVEEKEFEQWVDNSHAWAGGFKDFKFKTELSIPSKFFEIKYPEVGANDSLDYTMHLIKKHGRMDWTNKERVDRLEQEIRILHLNGKIDLLPYFFVGELVCDSYRKAGKLTGPGRGSAAGLSLSYYLSITHVDPLRYGLSVERFITLDRILSGKNPDIDQDLPDRELLVGPDENGGLLRELFGDHVAQISTSTTLKLKSAALDVARFKLGAVTKHIAELVHHFEVPPQGLEDHKFVFGYEDADSWIEGSVTRDPALKEYIAAYPDHWEIVQKCLGLGRGVGRHACAFVLANQPIGEFIPLTKIGGVTCTQFTAAAVEAFGGLKMDFLVLNSLNDLGNALSLIKQRSSVQIPERAVVNGIEVDQVQLVPSPSGQLCNIWDLPADQKVFADVATGKTETVFQFNTPSARHWLNHFAFKKENGNYGIDSIYSMAVFTALDRPGPLDVKLSNPDDKEEQHNALVEFTRRAAGKTGTADIPQVFDTLFPETYGLLVFQEQLQRLYQKITGCSGAEAEEFRSNIAKKKKDKILEAYPKFIAGAVANGLKKEQAEDIWALIGSWCRYGFNLAHAVCYAVIAYACAWLKHHYPLEWWTAVLQNASKTEIYEKFWEHCSKYVTLPSLEAPVKTFQIVGDKIQAPIWLIHGIGQVASDELCEGAPYTSFRDLVDKRDARKASHGRSAITRGIVYKLILLGGARSLSGGDSSVLSGIETYEQAAWDAAQVGKKRPSKVPPKIGKLPDTSALGLYQYRKQALPIYSEDLLKHLFALGLAVPDKDQRRLRYKVDGTPFTHAAEWQVIERMAVKANQVLERVMAVYIQNVRTFGKQQAIEFTMDFNQTVVKLAKWPDRLTGAIPQHFKKVKAGDIAIVKIAKYNTSKRFSIQDITVIQEGKVDDNVTEGTESEAG